MSTEGSLKAVIVAGVGNLIISAIKLIVSFITGSAGMFAESIHSFADTANQILLIVGSKRSKKEPDEQHAFGYGKEEYFYGLLVGVLLFFVGGLYSVYEGIHKIIEPEGLSNMMWIFIVLIISIIIEANSFYIAFKRFKKDKHRKVSWLNHLKNSTDANIFVIIIEDFAALTGLVIVLLSTTLAICISPVFDAIGSITIGLLLLSSSYFLSNEFRKLMIGESISWEMRMHIKQIIKSYPDVKHINNMRSEYNGNNKFILAMSLDLEDDIHVYKVESIISEMKADITAAYSNAEMIYIETSHSH